MTAQRTQWVLAHPDPNSLNHALFGAGVDLLARRGLSVTTSDLYAMGFDPTVSDRDFDSSQPHRGTVSARQKHATATGTLAPDIKDEQRKIKDADYLVLQFPLWWYAMPAMLKGWFDRVFTNGFAFGVQDESGAVLKYGEGGLAGKKVLVVVTAGDRASYLGPRGISGHIDDVLWPVLHGICHYTGMKVVRPHLITSTDRVDDARFEDERERLCDRLTRLAQEPPIPYRTKRGGDYDRDLVLREHLEPGQHGLSIHLA